MSDWNHLSCRPCWDERNPDRQPVKIIDPEVEPCCWCGTDTDTGIWVRWNPKEMQCRHSPPDLTIEVKWVPTGGRIKIRDDEGTLEGSDLTLTEVLDTIRRTVVGYREGKR